MTSASIKYMEENYDATPDQLMLDWNTVCATARFIGNGCNIQYRLWERSNGYLAYMAYTFRLPPLRLHPQPAPRIAPPSPRLRSCLLPPPPRLTVPNRESNRNNPS